MVVSLTEGTQGRSTGCSLDGNHSKFTLVIVSKGNPSSHHGKGLPHQTNQVQMSTSGEKDARAKRVTHKNMSPSFERYSEDICYEVDYLTLLTILFLYSFSVQQCKTLEDIHSRSHNGYLGIIFGSNILSVIPLWCAPHKLQSSSCNLQSFLV